jgi:NAD(P)-dependent dehydrogenase (short-subunit alcohol dehydrogenase family)
MSTVFVTGTSRGVGLGIVKELASRSDVKLVLASARDPAGSAELTKLIESSEGRIQAIQLDTDDEDSIKVGDMLRTRGSHAGSGRADIGAGGYRRLL